MKSGEEEYFVAGQLFTIAVAIIAISPRMPSDSNDRWTIGGKLSRPFRKALLYLVGIGLIRLICFHHILFPYLDLEKQGNQIWNVLDSILGIIHVVGQSFLCLTTAYLLQCQLSNVINIGGGPGENLTQYFVVLAILSLSGAIGASLVHPNMWSLINLAEAISCLPVLQTLRLYTTVTVTQQQQEQQQSSLLRGPVLTQMLAVEELWYCTTSMVSFLGEALGVNSDGSLQGHPLRLLLVAVEHNQDNGVDDWTRLLVHAIFLNALDELTHVHQPQGDPSVNGESPQPMADPETTQGSEQQTLTLRQRGATGV